MKNILAVVAALVPAVGFAQAGVYISGDIVVAPDTTGFAHTAVPNPNPLTGLPVCMYAARALLRVRPDRYDVVVSTTTARLDALNDELFGYTNARGNIVRSTDRGVWFGSPLVLNQPSDYGSGDGGVLQHCVFMGPMRKMPANPDGLYGFGMTGVEVMGHELGHHWLTGSVYDRNDGMGIKAGHRCDSEDPTGGSMEDTGRVNLHYTYWADSRSVMYGSWITPLGGGSYRFQGGDRGYHPLDQYFMGLRAASEVPDMLVINRGPGRDVGAPSLAKGETRTESGSHFMLSVQDFIRAQGARTPAYPNTQKCWRVAFVIVTPQGTTTASVQEIGLMEAYRRRFEEWFTVATDGRGRISTSLDAVDPCAEPDAGQPVDAGRPQDDAGLPDDGGVDAGIDAGPVDAGAGGTGGAPPVVEEPYDGGSDVIAKQTIKDRCGCTGAGPLTVALAALAFGLRRRRAQV